MRIMKLVHRLLPFALLTVVACHGEPVIDTGSKPPAVGGTIAGMVSTDGNAAVPGRKITAVNTATGTRYEETTAINGGYTMKVPEGIYRLKESNCSPARRSPNSRARPASTDPIWIRGVIS